MWSLERQELEARSQQVALRRFYARQAGAGAWVSAPDSRARGPTNSRTPCASAVRTHESHACTSMSRKHTHTQTRAARDFASSPRPAPPNGWLGPLLQAPTFHTFSHPRRDRHTGPLGSFFRAQDPEDIRTEWHGP